MNNELRSWAIALSRDAEDAAKKLFSAPSGFFIKINEEKYAKIKGGFDMTQTSLSNAIEQLDVEFSLSFTEFKKACNVASGIGCSVNKDVRLFSTSTIENNFKNILNDNGYQAYEIKTKGGQNISQILAASVIHDRKNDNKISHSMKI